MYPPARLARLPSALACLAFLASCGGGDSANEPESFYTSQYPALAAHASMDEEDFNRFVLNARRGTDITPETIKSLSVGASINTAASTYNLRPIFDLGLLQKEGWLNVDTTRSQQKTELRITSNKEASSASSQTTIDGSASGSYAGFKASAAYHQANAWKNTHSDGSVSVQMVSANTNNIVSILNSGFSGSDNLTPYLIGSKLTDEQLSSYVSVAKSAPTDACGGKAYYTGVNIGRYKLTDAEPYANIQLLTRMESVFGDLKTQYELCTDKTIQPQLVSQMVALRGKIESAIADFYAFNGDSFVSQTTSMNQGVGTGQLGFSNADGNTEAQYGASLSVQYQNPALGVGGTGAFQYYKQNGWATAVKNVKVSAESWPAGVADTTAWVSSLAAMLENQGSSLVPPMGSLPKDPGVKLPEAVGKKKEKQEGPPDSVFASYKEWKEYQEDKKKGVKDADVMDQAVERNDNQPINVNGDVVLLQAAQGGGDNAYLKLVAELDDLKQRATQPQPPKPPQAGAGSDSNLVRFDKMYVNGFEALPYDAVIPQLRPNLDIPGKDKTIGSFPNLMDTMLMVEKLGRLDAYLGFLANVSVSNVTPEMSARYHKFFETASSRAYDLVALSLGQGTDVSSAVLNGYKQAMLGGTAAAAQSELYKHLQDMDYYNYVAGTLLDPDKGRAWTAAPGGYIPMRWNADGGAQMVSWTALSQEWGGKRGREGVKTVDFSNPNADPLTLYRSMNGLQTPWYPVYIFNQRKAPTQVFVQNFGAYQAIYGSRQVVRPYNGATTEPLRSEPVLPRLTPLWPDYQVLDHEDKFPYRAKADMKSMRQSLVYFTDDGFNFRNSSWGYSVYFPKSGDDPTRLRKFNVFILAMDPWPVQDNFRDSSDWPGIYMVGNQHSMLASHISQDSLDHTSILDATYPAFRPHSGPRMARRIDNGAVEDVAPKLRGQTMLPSEVHVMLLPLNATTTGESLKQSLNYAPERTPLDVVTPTSLDLVNKLAVLLE